jgi:hypothetical protein
MRAISPPRRRLVQRLRELFGRLAARLRDFLVLAAFLAAALRETAPRRFAAERAWRAKAVFEAALRPSRFSALSVAAARFLEVGFLRRPAATARRAFVRVSSDVVPFFGGGRSTPARRAFERPMAIACLAERAPCLPSRM